MRSRIIKLKKKGRKFNKMASKMQMDKCLRCALALKQIQHKSPTLILIYCSKYQIFTLFRLASG